VKMSPAGVRNFERAIITTQQKTAVVEAAVTFHLHRQLGTGVNKDGCPLKGPVLLPEFVPVHPSSGVQALLAATSTIHHDSVRTRYIVASPLIS
jgi:hypothetical protein